MRSVVARTVTTESTDQGICAVVIYNGDEFAREILSLSYYTGSATSDSIPMYVLFPPDQTFASSSTIEMADPNRSYPIAFGPTKLDGSTFRAPHVCWPMHAKANGAGRLLIPPGWILAVNPLDVDMNGTMVSLIVTCRAEGS